MVCKRRLLSIYVIDLRSLRFHWDAPHLKRSKFNEISHRIYFTLRSSTFAGVDVKKRRKKMRGFQISEVFIISSRKINKTTTLSLKLLYGGQLKWDELQTFCKGGSWDVFFFFFWSVLVGTVLFYIWSKHFVVDVHFFPFCLQTCWYVSLKNETRTSKILYMREWWGNERKRSRIDIERNRDTEIRWVEGMANIKERNERNLEENKKHFLLISNCITFINDLPMCILQ